MGEMAKQPLWQDVSSHQGEIDYDQIVAIEGDNKIWGQFSRAGYGKYGGVKDMTFARNWEQSARFDYRASYWAYWDYFPLMHQLDLWYQQNPEIDFIPRMWDMEIELASPEFLSEQTWLASEEVLKRDGKRFIIYTRAGILERTLLKYWTQEQLNMHKYLLAQYDHSTPDNPEESEGIRIPAYPNGSWAIEPENILWKQTSSDFQIYPGSGRVDRDRWIWTDAETMHDDLREIWGEPLPPPVDCCDLLKQDVEANTASIAELADLVQRMGLGLESLEKMVQANGMDIGILSQDVNTLQKNYLMLDKAIGELDDTICSLPGGHDHPNWMKALGWVK